MAKTVDEAFSVFLAEKIDLNPEIVSLARNSYKSLLENIDELDGDRDFFSLYPDVNIQYGSFARGTKVKPLDDIDIMIGLSAKGITWDGGDHWKSVRMYKGDCTDKSLLSCLDGNILNSTKVLNRFKSRLSSLRDYCRSDIHKNGQAVTLNLLSKEWSFDVVPCFFTKMTSEGRQYYLIPNGDGNWIKTDPRSDAAFVKNSNGTNNHNVVRLVRMVKYWNRIKKIISMRSYLLETIVVRICAASSTNVSDYPDLGFKNILPQFAYAVMMPVYDLKGIQGDINDLSAEDRRNIRDRALADCEVANAAWDKEKDGDYEAAINKWRIVFGEDFPTYG